MTGGSSAPPPRSARPRKRPSSACPACSNRTRFRTLLRKRQDAQVAARSRAARSHAASAAPEPAAAPDAPPVSRQALAALRKELNGLVGAWSHRTGQPHGVIHAELRRTCGGPPLPQATADQIRARTDAIRRWAISGR